ncbi:MAG: PAS domain S-box protein [Magnetococcales bacterium]|nr:PAS domain S-box protein [Magnetococcales bacterium]NGZ25692.1 PAS domain S-box protein [Magnetococcales bacterium]
MTLSASTHKEKLLYWLPWLVLVVGIACSVYLWRGDIHKGQQQAIHNLMKESSLIQDRLSRRLSSMESLLRTVQGVFVASEQVTAEEWHRFFTAIQPEVHYKTLVALTFVAYVPSGGVQWFEQAMQNEVEPHFTITPPGPRTDYMVITHVEPKSVYKTAMGLDIGSHSHLRERASWSVSSGRPSLSNPVILPNVIKEKNLLVHLLPVYRSESNPATPTQRWEALLGWVVAFHHKETLFSSLSSGNGMVDVKVDHVGTDKEHLYSSSPLTDQSISLQESHVDAGARDWRLRFFTSQENLDILSDSSHINLLSGLVLSFALWALAGILVVGRQRALDIALRMTRALRESEERYRGIFQSVGEPVLLLQFNGTILDVNPACCAIFNCTRETLLGTAMPDLLHPLHRSIYFNSQTILENQQTFFSESLVRRQDGSIFPAEIRLSPALHQGEKAIIATLRDITARKLVDERVMQEKNRAEQYLAIAGTMIVALNNQGIITLINRKGCEVLEYSDDDLVGKSWFSTILPPDHISQQEEQFRRIISEEPGVLLDYEQQVVTQSQRLRLIAWRTTLVRDENERIIGTLSSGEDITQRRQAEDALKQAKQLAEQANVAKSEFLATMSHEIRTPLNAIMGMADVISEAPLSDEHRRYVNLLQRAGENLLDLINDILDLSKIESGRFELEHATFYLRPTMNRVREIMTHHAAAKGLLLTLEIHPQVPDGLHGDSRRLRQVLMNLLGNAIKFTHHGGIRLSVSPAPEGNSTTLLFQVADTGIGIPRDKLEIIFDMFTQADSSTTRRYGGTGLGLAISRRLVAMMGGTISVESTPGKGSIFSFVVAFHPASPSQDKTNDSRLSDHTRPQSLASAEEIIRHGPLRLLIVEDAEDNVALLRAYLKGQPYEIQVATNGQEGVDMFQSQYFHLVLMDVQMPIMDGHTATRTIRTLESQLGRKPVPIIAVSAYAFDEDVRSSLEAGCNAHITKPVNKTSLLTTIHRYLPAPDTSS